MVSKAILRQQCRERRFTLTPAEVAAKSRAIIEQLQKAVDWEQVRTLHCFLPIVELNEIDTRDLFESIWSESPQMATYTTPKIKGGGRVERVEPGFAKSPVKKIPKFDVIIVPMLGFDKSLHRLGYGGGYYDRFLATQPQAHKIGVCFEAGRLDSIPAEPHDIVLDQIVTELSQIDSG